MVDVRRYVLLTALAGCGDDAPTHHPGPCTATRVSGEDETLICTMDYDDAGRLITTDCTRFESREVTTRTYAGDTLSRITVSYTGEGTAEIIWTFGATIESASTHVSADGLTIERHESSYHPEGFAFEGHPQDPQNPLQAPDSITHWLFERENLAVDPPETATLRDVDYSYDGPPRQGVRTRSGTDGSSEVFNYDAQGRMTRRVVDITSYAYDYEGELLVAIRDTGFGGFIATYAYDAQDNLVSQGDEGTVRVDFGYDCW